MPPSERHIGYKRLDEGLNPGFAKLELSDDRTLSPREVAIVPLPPHDIYRVDISPKNATTLLIPQTHGITRR